MKISKATWISLAVGIFIIAGVSLGMVINQQNAQKANLEKQLSLARLKMTTLNNDKLEAQKAQMNTQLSEFAAQTAEVKTKLAFSTNNVDITDAIIQDAAECGVDIIDLSSPGLAPETLNGVEYETMSLSVKAQGTTGKAADFVYSLKKVFPTCMIKSVALDIIEPPPVDPSTPPATTATYSNEPFKDTMVSLSLVIYNYKGD